MAASSGHAVNHATVSVIRLFSWAATARQCSVKASGKPVLRQRRILGYRGTGTDLKQSGVRARGHERLRQPGSQTSLHFTAEHDGVLALRLVPTNFKHRSPTGTQQRPGHILISWPETRQT